jgi:hypothetical protein
LDHLIMRSLHPSFSVLALLGAVTLGAQAQSTDPAQVRARVRAEAAAAVAAGQTPRGEAPIGDLRAPLSTRARIDVQREARVAVAHGDTVQGEGTGYRSEPAVSVKSRVEVRAETREAMRLGLIPRGEQYAVPTPSQLEQVRVAGERALAQSRAVASR